LEAWKARSSCERFLIFEGPVTASKWDYGSALAFARARLLAEGVYLPRAAGLLPLARLWHQRTRGGRRRVPLKINWTTSPGSIRLQPPRRFQTSIHLRFGAMETKSSCGTWRARSLGRTMRKCTKGLACSASSMASTLIGSKIVPRLIRCQGPDEISSILPRALRISSNSGLVPVVSVQSARRSTNDPLHLCRTCWGRYLWKCSI
jgi:hypothetical protein